MTCDRCGSETVAFTTSYFNLDTICIACAEKEALHPDFERAREAEAEQVRRGNFNFQGIGLPPELKGLR